MYLLDTDVVSELRRPRRDSDIVAWIEPITSTDLFISTITIFEVEFGIEQQRRDDPPLARDLEAWLDDTLRLYGDRILPLTVNIARRWGRLSAQIGNKNVDGAIAATALEHGLTVVTRNIVHYTATGVAIVNPFEPQPKQR
jgi:predicted nucleic acid-binding protein